MIATALLPVGELLVGVALLFLRSRVYGLAASLVMHLLLIVAVGPWGLDHEAGVLLWNGYFIVQNVILIVAERRSGGSSGQFSNDMMVGSSLSRWGTSQSYILVVLVGAILFPVTRSAGYCDIWPAWAVYASSPARILVQVRHDKAAERLPKTMQQYVERRRINDGWSWLRIDLWSLTATGTPIYPEDRFQLAVAYSVVSESGMGDEVRIIHEGESDRWTGERDLTDLVSETEVSRLAKQFRLNTIPR